MATDNKTVLDYFKTVHTNIYNFTKFPSNNYKNLHFSDINGEIKFTDMLIDIFLLTNSNILLSNSNGKFIQLIRYCYENKKLILDKLI